VGGLLVVWGWVSGLPRKLGAVTLGSLGIFSVCSASHVISILIMLPSQ